MMTETACLLEPQVAKVLISKDIGAAPARAWQLGKNGVVFRSRHLLTHAGWRFSMARERPVQLTHLARLVESGRKLTFDYALGAAIAAVLPLPNLLWLRALVVAFLHYQLVRGIGKLWAFDQGKRVLDGFKILLCAPKALLFALLIGFIMIVLGIFLSWFEVLALGAVAFAYFWNFGNRLQHVYLNRFVQHSRVAATTGPSVQEHHDET